MYICPPIVDGAHLLKDIKPIRTTNSSNVLITEEAVRNKFQSSGATSSSAEQIWHFN